MVRIKFVPFDENMRPISRATTRKSPKKANISTDQSDAEGSDVSIDEEETQVIDLDEAEGDEATTENAGSIQHLLEPMDNGTETFKLHIPEITLKNRDVNRRESESSNGTLNRSTTPSKSNATEKHSSDDEDEESPIIIEKTSSVRRSRSGRIIKPAKATSKSKKDTNEEDASASEKSPLLKTSRSGRVIKPTKAAAAELQSSPESEQKPSDNPDSGKSEENSQPVRSRTRRFTKAGKDIEESENGLHKEVSSENGKTPAPATPPKTSRSGRILKPAKTDHHSSSESSDSDDEEPKKGKSEKPPVPQTSRSGRSIKTVTLFQSTVTNGNSTRKRSSSPEWTNRKPRNQNKRGRPAREGSSSSSEERDPSFKLKKKNPNLERRTSSRNEKGNKKRYHHTSEEEDTPVTKRNKRDTRKSRVSRNSKRNSGKDNDSESESEDSDESVEEVLFSKRASRRQEDRKVKNGKRKPGTTKDEEDEDRATSASEEEEIPLSKRRTPRKVQESKNSRLTRNNQRNYAKHSDDETDDENDKTTKNKDSNKSSTSQNRNNHRSASKSNNEERSRRGALSKAPHSGKSHNINSYYVTPIKSPLRNHSDASDTHRSNVQNATIDQDEEYIDLKKLELTKKIELMDHEIYLRKLDALKKERELTLHPSAFTAELTGACNVN